MPPTPTATQFPRPESAHPIHDEADIFEGFARADLSVRRSGETVELNCAAGRSYAAGTVYEFESSGQSAFALWMYRTAEERSAYWTIDLEGIATPRDSCDATAPFYASENLVVKPLSGKDFFPQIFEITMYIGLPLSPVIGGVLVPIGREGEPIDGEQLIWALEDAGLHFRASDTGVGCNGMEGAGDFHEGLYGDPGYLGYRLWAYPSPAALETEWFVNSYGTARPKVPDCVVTGTTYRNQNLILQLDDRDQFRHGDLLGRIAEVFMNLDEKTR